MSYAEFLDAKSQYYGDSGFDPEWLPDWLFDFQRDLVSWSIRKGRAATLADCGLGKTPMELVWAENIARKTGGRVLILVPLAVAHQMIEEARNPGETVLTPFMGIGTEVYAAVAQGRRGIGVELKASYYRQAVRNVEAAASGHLIERDNLELDLATDTDEQDAQNA